MKNTYSFLRVTLMNVTMYFFLWWFFSYVTQPKISYLGLPYWFFWSCLFLPFLLILGSILTLRTLEKEKFKK